jgi:hypothetical protein
MANGFTLGNLSDLRLWDSMTVLERKMQSMKAVKDYYTVQDNVYVPAGRRKQGRIVYI